MARGSNPVKVQQWTERFGRFQGSGQTVTQFCQAEGVSPPSFYHWKKKLSPQTQTPAKSGRTRSSFQPVELLAAGQSTMIRLSSGIEIELGNDLRVVDLVLTQLFELPNASSEGRSC